jgi:pimeloyl-ACP methyl ester carboxylesterase
MSSFLLVHGAWLGGWSWREVARILQRDGHDAFTPTLTGMGERQHLAGPSVDLETHISDILSVIEYERLDDFALVAHSYGGMVATAVADRIPERIRTLIYVDAALPEDGQAMLDLVSEKRKQENIDNANKDGEGYQVPSSMLLNTGIEDDNAREAFVSRTGFHPLPALMQPVHLTGRFNEVKNKAYLFASQHNTPRFRNYMNWAQNEPGWTGEELDTSHFPMATIPEETAATLVRIHG